MTETEAAGSIRLLPGWVLQSSPYTIARSEVKFATRRKAKRHGWYTGWDIIRPSTVDMCWHAREELVKAGTRTCRATSSSQSSSGQTTVGEDRSCDLQDGQVQFVHRWLGQNYITDYGRRKGIQAYTNVIQRYALRGLLLKVEKALEMCHKSFGDDVAPHELERRLEAILSPCRNENCLSRQTGDGDDIVLWPSLPWDESSERHILWNHQRCILKKEIPALLGKSEAQSPPSDLVLRLLELLVGLERDFANRVFKSKQRDDSRGHGTIPGYKSSHISAEDDVVIKAALEEIQRVERSVGEIRSALLGPISAVSRL